MITIWKVINGLQVKLCELCRLHLQIDLFVHFFLSFKSHHYFSSNSSKISAMLEFISCMNLEPLFFQITWNIYFDTTYYKQVVFT